jgi:methyl-accepting chemotaxis protein
MTFEKIAHQLTSVVESLIQMQQEMQKINTGYEVMSERVEDMSRPNGEMNERVGQISEQIDGVNTRVRNMSESIENLPNRREQSDKFANLGNEIFNLTGDVKNSFPFVALIA